MQKKIINNITSIISVNFYFKLNVLDRDIFLYFGNQDGKTLTNQEATKNS